MLASFDVVERDAAARAASHEPRRCAADSTASIQGVQPRLLGPPAAGQRCPKGSASTRGVFEELAHLAYLTFTIRADAHEISEALRDKHFLRKHGPAASYGQESQRR